MQQNEVVLYFWVNLLGVVNRFLQVVVFECDLNDILTVFKYRLNFVSLDFTFYEEEAIIVCD